MKGFAYLITLLFFFGDTAILYFLYTQHKRSAEERWERGISNVPPDIGKLRMRYLLVWGILQCGKLWLLLEALSHFPAQR